MAVAAYLIAETVIQRYVDVVAYVHEVQEAVITAAVDHIPGTVRSRSQHAVGNGIRLKDGPVRDLHCTARYGDASSVRRPEKYLYIMKARADICRIPGQGKRSGARGFIVFAVAQITSVQNAVNEEIRPDFIACRRERSVRLADTYRVFALGGYGLIHLKCGYHAALFGRYGCRAGERGILIRCRLGNDCHPRRIFQVFHDVRYIVFVRFAFEHITQVLRESRIVLALEKVLRGSKACRKEISHGHHALADTCLCFLCGFLVHADERRCA